VLQLRWAAHNRQMSGAARPCSNRPRHAPTTHEPHTRCVREVGDFGLYGSHLSSVAVITMRATQTWRLAFERASSVPSWRTHFLCAATNCPSGSTGCASWDSSEATLPPISSRRSSLLAPILTFFSSTPISRVRPHFPILHSLFFIETESGRPDELSQGPSQIDPKKVIYYFGFNKPARDGTRDV
jgi:hypothetical protein